MLFVPSEWVGPAPRGIIDTRDKKFDILGVIQRVGPGTQDSVRSVGPRPLNYIDHRIVGDGNERFGLTDMGDIGRGQNQRSNRESNDVGRGGRSMGRKSISWTLSITIWASTAYHGYYLGYLDFRKLFPDFPKGRSLKAYYQQGLTEGSK
ncbi:uncharacterized protein BO88DRAFT_464694 [Aspergillus vadensis CBS 113365]|uniref:Uncharacterized protein n=1 Tax=Aspergillus vadensis (strain CBS 113365 / IMI 142717 / IBT 24658) TaxID=1448311 RepID=A0A319BXR2_ASPVC|nr:hypothetical protein BO88DRAFT_464694 [Aspergillus vadensis CBS 113365]PYH67908.1 hypothetical protein BO88DRAFT_464694 [Aspergillus vadensis CBS 113365]